MNKGMFDVDLGYIAVHAEVIVLKKNRTKRRVKQNGECFNVYSG